MKRESYIHREKSELPLIELDQKIRAYSKPLGIHILANYRDFPSRTFYTRVGRTVKFLQIKLNPDSSDFDNNILCYDVYKCSYRIKIPLLCFWNTYFEINDRNCEKIAQLEAPLEIDVVSKMIHELMGFQGQ